MASIITIIISITTLMFTSTGNNGKIDCEKLMNEALPFAEKMLQQYGEFIPYGYAMKANGEIVSISGQSKKEHPPSMEIMVLLNDGFRNFVDDIRKAPEGWIHYRWPKDVYPLLDANLVTEISLDHDLGNDEIGTGYDIINYIEKCLNEQLIKIPKIHIHTMNPVARERMLQGLHKLLSYT